MSIDSCYEGIIAKLNESGKIYEVSKKLMTLTTNADRGLYVYDTIKSLKLFPKVLEVKKCHKVSTHYRNLGNQYFQRGNKNLHKTDKYQAWQYYNLSLLHAPLDSDNYALALSNRSAVFFTLKKYDECIKDIEKVFSMKHPDNLKGKLNKRIAECKSSVSKKGNNNNAQKIQELLALKGPTDEKYICASSKLKVVHSKELGRHVVAKEDIKVGEVLAREQPYFALLLKSQFLFFCNYCLSMSLNLMPCETCCFVLYCSDECKQKAWKEYHKVECSLMATLVHMDFTKLELLGLRTAIKARTDHSDWNSLLKTIREAEANENTENQGLVKVDDKWVYDSKYYTSIHMLSSNVDKRSPSDIFQKSVTAAVFLYFLSESTDFMKVDGGEDTENVRRCVAGTLLHHCMTSPTNMHGIASNIQNGEGIYVKEYNIASAPYAFHSLINHSCAPNVTRATKLGSTEKVLFALRPIKKGMQILDNYGYHHALEDRLSRQQGLKFQYKFICSCEACVNNWPTYFGLRSANLPAHIRKMKDQLLRRTTIENLQKGDESTAMELFKPLCALAELLEPYAPCAELADCQETLKQCCAIFEGLVPFGYGNLVPWSAIPPKC
ncbi:SET and MYND domain-containing protein 4 [Manduca sexta]|uniref:Protein-lysine N-methyltransferase SMYD4 n=1 Tax=Manduca sexta TaxID=7130 RepID=A0A921ZC09_MANSE|nr:SET and MYND domain-containing protein 4 [Manduca sexta]KAG6455116.1 hypothetical protein O3G_MSEX009034 [Manduca sexta]